MDKAKHTPGPWKHVHQVNTDHSHDIIANRFIVASCGSQKATDGECAANARLISAAPELLEALQECITDAGATCFKNGMNRATLMTRRLMAINDIARAVIAKATDRKED